MEKMLKVKDVLVFHSQMKYYESYRICHMILGKEPPRFKDFEETQASDMLKIYMEAINKVWTYDNWIDNWAKPYATVIDFIPLWAADLRKEFSKEET